MAPKKRNFGNIRKLPSGRFQARYTAPDGCEIKAPTTFDTRRHADQWLATEHADLTRGTWRAPDAGTETLAEYLRSWLETHSGLRPRTRELYARLGARFVMDGAPDSGGRRLATPLGSYRLREITVATVRQWYSWVLAESRAGALAKEPATGEGSPRWNRALRAWAVQQGLAVKPTGRIPAEVREQWVRSGRPQLLPPNKGNLRAGRAQTAQAYRLLHAVLETAVSDGLITSNPCQIKTGGTAKAPERKPATPEEVVTIAAACPERYRVSVLIGAFGALRAGEIFALDRRSVDFAAGSVTVRRSVSYVSGKGHEFGEPKSDMGYRTVHLPPHIMEAIAIHMDQFTGHTPDALLLTTTSGSPVPSSRRTTWFRRAADSVGREDLTFHGLRHTGATWAAQGGATLADLQSRLGHSTPRAAMIYQHTSRAADQEIAKRLAALAEVS